MSEIESVNGGNPLIGVGIIIAVGLDVDIHVGSDGWSVDVSWDLDWPG